MRRSFTSCRFTILVGVLLLLGLWVAAAPALAGNTKPPTVEQRLAALESQMVQLQTQVGALQSTVASQGDRITGLEGTVATQAGRIATLEGTVGTQATKIASQETLVTSLQANPVLTLGPYVSVNQSAMNGVKGPNIVFTGANLHIVSGSGKSWDGSNATGNGYTLSGLGNLIIGYDEWYGGTAAPQRGGSHNLVVGTGHQFAGFGGFLAGCQNTLTASADCGSISGGETNTVSAPTASVSGGAWNTASSRYSTVSGGYRNLVTTGEYATVSGGKDNIASGSFATVSGGYQAFATASYEWVGGNYRTTP